MMKTEPGTAIIACQYPLRFTVSLGTTTLKSNDTNTLGGTRAVDLDGFRKAFCEGAPWGLSVSKYAILHQDDPGIDSLLERVD